VKDSAEPLPNRAQWWDCDQATGVDLWSYSPILMLRFLSSLLLLSAISPQAQAASFQCGQASHYGIGDGYHGQRTASGQRFDAYAMTAAHPSLPLGSRVLVKNRDNGKTVLVTINDRGPYAGGRVLDLSYGSFSRIASPGQGVANICMSRA
jgi:rare lipoprotein A